MTGLDHRAFNYLLSMFQHLYDVYTTYGENGEIRRLSQTTRGRPRTRSSTACIGLVLTFYRTRGSCFSLCLLFGINSSVCNIVLRFSKNILHRVLSTNSLSALFVSGVDEIEFYIELTVEKYPLLQVVYAVADGLKLYLQQSGDIIIQNKFYNEWTHDHYVSNVIVLAPSGLVIACTLNPPSSMHDSQIWDWVIYMTWLKICLIKQVARLSSTQHFVYVTTII